MRLFNAFQVVAFFAALQFGLGWVSGQDFRGANIALWGGAAVYLVAFGFMIASVYMATEKWYDEKR